MGSKPSKRTDKKSVVAPASRSPNCTSDRGALRTFDVGSDDVIGGPRASNSVNERQSPERRGFNNPMPARSGGSIDRALTRQTRMLGAEDPDGAHEDLDERPFHQEKVNRVPTKALLKPPKNPESMIADPDEDQELY
ncbi:hypothetical protein conserved [Leishmania donovani]|nr:hypothetical protein LdCL_260020500 [Leishmania donovani]CAC9496897.1 hypothetical_protein_-_conserved [Leishmania infantum]TPP41184.1 hypothetical protein CGC21_32075 [Leishmania donovani]TPP52028.1 hypothetical protein CGC20_5225 [Leishmania donovani]CAJ1989738.1 hypothetical protein conserved [Leishmania donovani]